VTDGRTMIVTVGVSVSVAVRMIRIVIVGVPVPVGSRPEGGSSMRFAAIGVEVLAPGRKGVFDGGRNALRSCADPSFQAAGIDPVIREQPNASSAAAGQNNLRITRPWLMTYPREKSRSILSMTILIPNTMTKITSFLAHSYPFTSSRMAIRTNGLWDYT
jgi:hypothetical protein